MQEFKNIKLRQGEFTKVDGGLFNRLNRLSWFLTAQGYASNRKLGLLHRYIMKTPKGKVTDHINGDRLDNRKSNLRITNQSINILNSSKVNSKSGHRGITWLKVNKKWRSHITHLYKFIDLGSYSDLDAAIVARKAAERRFL